MSFHMRKPHNVVDRAVTTWTSENGAVISITSIYMVSDDDLPFVHILASLLAKSVKLLFKGR